MTSENVADLLENVAAEHPRRLALVAARGGSPDRGILYDRLTYADLQGRVERVSAALRRHGFRQGDRALIFVPMSIPLYILLLGILRAGGIALFLDPWCTPQQMAHCCTIGAPAWFIAVPRAFLFLLKHRALRGIPYRVSTRGFLLGPRLTFGRLLREGGDEMRSEKRSSNDTAMVTFTSGTTGRPKGADRTHGFLRAQHDVLNDNFGYRPGDVDMSTFPIFTLNSIASGMTAVLPHMDFRHAADADPSWILQQFADGRVSTTVGSPAFFDAVGHGAMAAGTTCPMVRAAFTGGGPVRAETLSLMQRLFPNAEVSVAYGSTEAEPIAHIHADDVIALMDETADGKGTCVGLPIQAIQCRLLPINEQPPACGGDVPEVPIGSIGEVTVSGPHVCRAYYGDDESTRANKIRDAQGNVWHRTGDLAYRDALRRLWLVGRLSSRIKRANTVWHPGCIEAAVVMIKGIRAAACVGLPDNAFGQALHLCWVPEIGEKAHPEENVTDAICELFTDRGWPLDGVHEMDALPTDPRHNTKIDRQRLRASLEGRNV